MASHDTNLMLVYDFTRPHYEGLRRHLEVANCSLELGDVLKRNVHQYSVKITYKNFLEAAVKRGRSNIFLTAGKEGVTMIPLG